ncbi:SDR family oxidoreductase [Aliarcobacter cryaerophilus]|uniref:SDR family NAD(P)-dependent oxidoreductase n=1 Tax=Aliarcobacter cryaerophilus TaxID=28198 RepID=UPI003DA681A9
MLNLSGKKILVMGATGFIGRQIALKLANLGANLVISGREKNKLDELLNELNGKHNALVFDVNDLSTTMDFMEKAVSIDKEKISALVYCIGIFPLRPLKSLKTDFLHNMMHINFYSFIEIVRCFSNKKICEGGSIVSLSSYASTSGDKGQLAYAASKAAMDSSIKIISKELFNKNIRINAIRPASLLSDEINFSDLPSGIQKSINNMGTGPICPDKLAEQIAFLVSDSSSGIYGRCLDVKGYLL